MGNQHNTHIKNDTKEVISITLTDNNNRNTSKIIEPDKYVCIPTVHGSNTVSVFRKLKDADGFNKTAEATYTDESDYSFIVKEDQGLFDIARSKYGDIDEEDTGLR